MLVPYHSDAPIYHWPFATAGVLATNVFVYAWAVSTGEYDEAIEPWILHYGEGLHPVEWVTSNFIHLDFFHLLANMFILWGAGLIVEGKIGWWKFLLVYLGIGVLECVLEQTMMLGASYGGSLGASAVIFGLLSITLLWAPKNDFHCVLFLGTIFAFDMSVMNFVVMSLGIELVMMILTGFSLSSAVLHLMGAIVGAVVGFVFLKRKWVDCEGWDLLSVLAERHNTEDRSYRRRNDEEKDQRTPDEKHAAALQQIRQFLADKKPELVLVAHRRLQRDMPGWKLPAAEFRKLISVHQEQGKLSESVPLMVDYLAQYNEQGAQVRLLLAKVLLETELRPAQAQRVLAKVDITQLSPAHQKYISALKHKAQQRLEDGECEVQTEDW